MKKLSDLNRFQEERQELVSSAEQIQQEQALDNEDEARPIFIPGHIVADHSLSSGQKLLYGRIIGLSKKRGFCWATNEEIGRPINLKRETVKDYLSVFYKRQQMTYTVVRDDKTKQVIERRIYTKSSLSLGGNNPLPLGENNLPGRGLKPPKSISDVNVLYNVNNEGQERAVYYADVLAGLLDDNDSMSFYINACLQNDPNVLLRKAKEITQDGGARNPGAVFTAWLKTQGK